MGDLFVSAELTLTQRPRTHPGNVATEDVVYMLHGLGVTTGINVPRLLAAADYICVALGRPTSSRAGRALAAAAEREGKAVTAA